VLKDYSGNFKPDLKLRDFSEDALKRLWKCGGDLYMGLNSLYQDVLREKLGEEKAVEISREVWIGRPNRKDANKGKAFIVGNENGTERAIRVIREAHNLWGTDVESFFKLLQVDPTMEPYTESEFVLKNKNHGIYTVKRCYYLDMMWEAGEDARQKHVCEELDGVGFPMAAYQFNPKMKCIALKMPVKGANIACQWECIVEE